MLVRSSLGQKLLGGDQSLFNGYCITLIIQEKQSNPYMLLHLQKFNDVDVYFFPPLISGAFLIPFFTCMILEGFPLMILEYTIGQRFRTSALQSFKKMHPCFIGIGIGCIVVSLYFCLYYVVIITWCVYYFFISLTNNLPWIREKLCPKAGIFAALQANLSLYNDKWANTSINASDYLDILTKRDYYAGEVSNFSDCCVRDPSMWHFYSSTLRVSTDIDDFGEGINGKLFGCLLLAWFLTYICIAKGIKTSGKVRKMGLIFCTEQY